MEIKRKISYKKHLLSFFITLTIFVIVFLSFEILNNKRLNYIKERRIELKREVNYFSALKIDFCKEVEKSPLVTSFYRITTYLNFMEETLGKDNSEIVELKESFYLIQLEYLNFIKEANHKCAFKYQLIPIILFYSGEEGQEDVEKQKFILSYFESKYSNLRIFSFDYSLDLPEIKKLKLEIADKKNKTTERDGVEEKEASFIMIIDNKVFHTVQDLENLEKILKPFDLEKN